MPIQIGQVESTFSDPLGLLSDCHRRIERFLDTLLRVTELRAGAALNHDERSALENALNYFEHAAPNHTADEEESLFPRMMEHAALSNPVALAVIAELEDGHERAAAAHEDVDRLGRAWLRDNALPPADAAELLKTLRELKTFYQRHIAAEDNELFPMAGRMLDAAELAAVGAEMQARRRIAPQQRISFPAAREAASADPLAAHSEAS